MTVILQYRADRVAAWRAALEEALPDERIRIWPDVGLPEEVELIVAMAPEPGSLNGFRNLRFVAATGAGVEYLLDPELAPPPDIPIVRLVDDALTEGMAEYVLAAVLRYHRGFPQYELLGKAAKWEPLSRVEAHDRSIGIMGLGELGRAAAHRLRANGFRVLGWSRSPKTLDGVECFAGSQGLRDMLPQCWALVCLLPLTAQTDGILDSERLSTLPRGAQLINAARGAHLVDDDLLRLLESGHLAHATLDVFRDEPLPPDHPFWQHPRITVTPHVASLTVPATAARRIAENLDRARRGEQLHHMVDRSRGY